MNNQTPNNIKIVDKFEVKEHLENSQSTPIQKKRGEDVKNKEDSLAKEEKQINEQNMKEE